MAGEKVSDMPAATSAGTADLIYLVQGGSDKSCTRDAFMLDTASNQVYLKNGGGSVIVSGAGATAFTTNDGEEWTGGTVSDPDLIHINTNGDLLLSCLSGRTVILDSDGHGVVIGSSGAGVVTIKGTTTIVSYQPGTPAYWSSPSPTNLGHAIDRLASVIYSLLGPIPDV